MTKEADLKIVQEEMAAERLKKRTEFHELIHSAFILETSV